MSDRLRMRPVRQLEVGDCGAACLATVLRAYAIDVSLADLRDATSTGREGVSAAGIASAARRYGFDAVGVRCPPSALAEMSAGTILHWRGNHFVVLEQATPHGLRVIDPDTGRRLVTTEHVATMFSGTALQLTPPSGLKQGSLPRTRPRQRLAPYREFLRGAGRPALLALALAAAVQAFVLVNPLILRDIVDNATAGRAPTGPVALGLLVVVLAAGFFAATAARLLALLALQRLVDLRLTRGVFEHLVALPVAFLMRRSTGDLALRLRSAVEVRQVLTAGALSALFDGGLVLGYLVLIAAVDSGFALLTASAVLAQALVVGLSWRRLRQRASEALEAQALSQARLLEILAGLDVLKVAGAAGRAVAGWTGLLEREVDADLRHTRLGGLVDAAIVAVRFAATPALLLLGAQRVQSGDLGLADMLALAALSAAVTVPVGGLLGTLVNLSTVASYVERLDDLLTSPVETRPDRRPPRKLRGAVELRDVSFSYSALSPPAIHGIELIIEPGEHIAVVGASGSGKTTLALVIATLYPPAHGTMLLDGHDVADDDPELVRRQIGVVTQQAPLFSQTIRDNIVLARPDVTDEDVFAAATAAAIHDDVMALPNGYETRLGNSGTGLSGGQRQRLALARALVTRPPLLVLDEATSALDPVTERTVQGALDQLGCTRVVIAHRLSTLAQADRVILLSNGQIAAQGTFPQLRRRSAEFRALAAADRARATP